MPSWTKVRADLRPHDASGFVYLDKDALATAVVADGPWIDMVTHSTNIGGYVNPMRYKKDAAGFVTVDGRWGCTGAVASSNLFQLPVGYRPTYSMSGLDIGGGGSGSCFLTLGDRVANTMPGLGGLANVYRIKTSVCALKVASDGWISINGNVWGELERVGANADGAFDVGGTWRNWGVGPWENLYGRVANFTFPTT